MRQLGNNRLLFGSVLLGTDRNDRDLDLPVDPLPEAPFVDPGGL